MAHRRAFLMGALGALASLGTPRAFASDDVWLDGEDGPTEVAADDTHLYWLNQTDEAAILRRRAFKGGKPETLGRIPGAGVALMRIASGLLLANMSGTFFVDPIGAKPQPHVRLKGDEAILGLHRLSGHLVLRTTHALYEIKKTQLVKRSSQSDAVLASDDHHLYLGLYNGRIQRLDWTKGKDETLTRIRGSKITGLVLHGSRLYFASKVSPGNGPPPSDGGIGSLPTTGGDVRWLIEGQKVGWLIEHAKHLVYRVGMRRFAIPRKGGKPRDVGTPFGSNHVIVGDVAYTTEGSYGKRIRRVKVL